MRTRFAGVRAYGPEVLTAPLAIQLPIEVAGGVGLLVHRFLGIDHLRWIHVIHDDLYPSL